MQSPSPEAGTDHQSDTDQTSAHSLPTSPNIKPSKAAEAARAVSPRKGLVAASSRANPSRVPAHNFGSTPTNALLTPDVSLKQTHGAAREADSSHPVANAAQAEQASAAVGPSTGQQSRIRQDAAQQTVSFTAGSVLKGQNASVQSDMPVMPTNKREVPKAVPTDERATQTPMGHASPQPFQRLPPGASSNWPCSHTAHSFDVSLPGQMQSQSLRHEGQSPTQMSAHAPPLGNGPRRQGPSRQWADVPFGTRATGDSDAADMHLANTSASALPVSPVQSQQRPSERQDQFLHKLFCSPLQSLDQKQLTMQTGQHFPAEQPTPSAERYHSQVKPQLQDSQQTIPAQPLPALAPTVASNQDFAQQPAGVPSKPTEALNGSLSAAPTAFVNPSVHFVSSAAALQDRDAPQAQPVPASAWLLMPPAAPGLAEPSLPSQTPWHAPFLPAPNMPSHMSSHMPSHVASHMPSHMPSQVAPHMPSHMPTPHQGQPHGVSYASWQSPPFLPSPVRQAAPYAAARGPSIGFDKEQWRSTGSRPAAMMQRQQGVGAMPQLQRHMYPGRAHPQRHVVLLVSMQHLFDKVCWCMLPADLSWYIYDSCRAFSAART